MHVVLVDTQYEIRRFAFGAASPAFLLPVLHKALIRRTLQWLQRYRVRNVSLITRRNPAEDYELSQAILDYDLRIAGSLDEVLLRARRAGRLDEALLVLQANLHPLPQLSIIAAEHQKSGRAVTFVKGTAQFGPGQYAYGPPALVLASPVMARVMARRDSERPLADIARIARNKGLSAEGIAQRHGPVEINNPFALWQANLGELRADNLELKAAGFRQRGPKLWVADGARVGKVDVDPGGGLVAVGAGAELVDGSAVRGPTYVAPGAVIERNSFVHQGLLLPDANLSRDSFVARAVVGPTLMQRVAS
jgi:hypothetical protein